MNGMRIPVASAGSNQAAGNPTWTAQVSWPSGGAAAGARTPAKTTRKSTMSPSNRFMIGVLPEIVPEGRQGDPEFVQTAIYIWRNRPARTSRSRGT